MTFSLSLHNKTNHPQITDTANILYGMQNGFTNQVELRLKPTEPVIRGSKASALTLYLHKLRLPVQEISSNWQLRQAVANGHIQALHLALSGDEAWSPENELVIDLAFDVGQTTLDSVRHNRREVGVEYVGFTDQADKTLPAGEANCHVVVRSVMADALSAEKSPLLFEGTPFLHVSQPGQSDPRDNELAYLLRSRNKQAVRATKGHTFMKFILDTDSLDTTHDGSHTSLVKDITMPDRLYDNLGNVRLKKIPDDENGIWVYRATGGTLVEAGDEAALTIQIGNIKTFSAAGVLMLDIEYGNLPDPNHPDQPRYNDWVQTVPIEKLIPVIKSLDVLRPIRDRNNRQLLAKNQLSNGTYWFVGYETNWLHINVNEGADTTWIKTVTLESATSRSAINHQQSTIENVLQRSNEGGGIALRLNRLESFEAELILWGENNYIMERYPIKGVAILYVRSLRNAKLTGLPLRKRNLQGVDFQGAELEHAKLDDANLTQANFIEAKNLETATLRFARYDSATIWPTGFDCTNKKMFGPGTDLSNETLDQDLSGVDLTKAKLHRTSMACTIDLKTKFDRASLIGATLSSMDLAQADFRTTDLRNARLYHVRNISKARLNTQALQGVIFECKLAGLDLTGANLKKAVFQSTEDFASIKSLQGANLEEAVLRGVDFGTLDMKDVKLRGAKLEGADLSHVVNLPEIVERKYNDHRIGVVKESILRFVSFDKKTRFPKGYVEKGIRLWKEANISFQRVDNSVYRLRRSELEHTIASYINREATN